MMTALRLAGPAPAQSSCAARSQSPNRKRAILLLAVLALVSAAPAAAFQLQSGIGFVAVTDAPEGAELILRTAAPTEVQRGLADRLGSLLFRDLVQGATYSVTETGGSATSATVRVFADHPPQSFYQGQALVEGLNYLRMRDGTRLAAMVRPPPGHSLADGPFPTVVEYSGYAVADPDNPQPSTLLVQALGYATVGVNMRGSGCSGGAFDLFDYPTTADGYDTIEIVAAQPWVLSNKVGMVGLSFSGISQLFVAGAQPPHLAAIAPLSVIGDLYRAVGYPGGIFNNGFGQSWLQERRDDAAPAPEGGQAWAIQRVNSGDTTCFANQQLRLQTLDPLAFTTSAPYYAPALMDQRSPITWVSQIKVPIFLGGAWQDEQTSSEFATLLHALPNRRDVKIIVQNGVHSSPLEPIGLWNWIAFLDLYVGQRVPDTDRLAPFVGAVYGAILGPDAPVPPLPPELYLGFSTVTEARRHWESQPRIRVLMENGAGAATPGLPAPTFELGLRKWPAPGTRPTTWYFGPNGTLTRTRPTEEGSDRYRPDPEARPMQTIPGQSQSASWLLLPNYDWRPLVDGTAVAYVTEPLTADVTVVGPGSVDLWLRSSAADTDLQVTLTEVRPDGLETYVQSGWLRASHRALDRRRSTRLAPVQTHLAIDAAPLPANEIAALRVGIFAVGHVFHAGSRLRLSLEAPGGDRTRWAFDTFATGGLVVNEVVRTRAQPSRVVLPVLPGVAVPPGRPPCPGLRGQPCRTYVPAANGG